MGKAFVLLLVISCGLNCADARSRHHHRYHPYLSRQTLPGEDTPMTGRQSTPRGGRDRLTVVAPPDHLPSEKPIDTAQIVPADWKLEPGEPNRSGQRFLSPDGTAWFEWYRVPARDESIAAHMKSVAFGEGEEVTKVRGERNWIAVSGFHGDRIFYREALLACAGDRWHHIAFEYPSIMKASMIDFVRRAAEAVEATQNSGCDIPVSPAG
jgi:hypothetical protein